MGKIRNPIVVFLISSTCCPIYCICKLTQIEGEFKRLLGQGQGRIDLVVHLCNHSASGMPKLIAEARQRAGTATEGEPGLFGYLFLPGLYLLPKDANEIWERLGVRAREFGKALHAPIP